MLWSSILDVLVLAVYIHRKGQVDSFPTGAGSCVEGPAVGGVHLEAATVLRPTDLQTGKFDVLVNGQSLIHGTLPHIFTPDTSLTVDVMSELHLFKGALLRVSESQSKQQSTSSGSSFVFEAGTNAGPAFACDIFDGVKGITHTNAEEKRFIGGMLHVAPDVDQVRLDVTLVIATNTVLSFFFHQYFDLRFATPSPMPTNAMSPPSVSVPTPTSSPTGIDLTRTTPPTPMPTVLLSQTNAPSLMSGPNLSPTPKKLLTPTTDPDQSPTPFPVISSTSLPTPNAGHSVEEPTSAEVLSHTVTNIQLDLVNVTSITYDESLRWESLTSVWFAGYYEANGPVEIKSSSIVLYKSSTPVTVGEKEYALRVLYDQTLEYYYTESSEHDFIAPERLVVLPFESPEWNAAYVQILRTDPSFAPSLLTLGDSIGVPIVLGSSDETSPSRKLTNGLIWLVVALCFVLVMYVSYRLLKENRGGLKVPDFSPDTFSFIGSESSRRFGGDASFRSLFPDQGDSPPIVGCQYEVVAPAGKLKIILKTHEEYGIVIQMISEDSPLAGKVSVGDQLISVDEIDVREQTASLVNRAIEARKNNAMRKFVFVKGVGLGADDDDASTNSAT